MSDENSEFEYNWLSSEDCAGPGDVWFTASRVFSDDGGALYYQAEPSGDGLQISFEGSDVGPVHPSLDAAALWLVDHEASCEEDIMMKENVEDYHPTRSTRDGSNVTMDLLDKDLADLPDGPPWSTNKMANVVQELLLLHDEDNKTATKAMYVLDGLSFLIIELRRQLYEDDDPQF